jgi:hypothetical protein
MNPCVYFLWGYLKDCVYHNNPPTVQELQAEIDAVSEEITDDCCMAQLINLWFIYSKSMKLKGLILNMCVYEEHI